jgi:hypothetical protein
MKTTTIRNFAIVILLSVITSTAFAQETIRQNRWGNDNKGTKVTEKKQQESPRQKSHRNYKANNQLDYKHQGVKSGLKVPDNKSNGHVYGHEIKRKNNSYQHGYQTVTVNNKHHQGYYHRLPARNVNRFSHRGIEYYNVDNMFYRHHSQYGYYVVDAPFLYTQHLPSQFFVRSYNGNSYCFANGYLYLPFERGYLLVPQTERPMCVLNIVLN